jgi:hypothetical protein
VLQLPVTAELPNWVAFADGVYGEVGEYDYGQSYCGGQGDPCPTGQDLTIGLYDVPYMFPPQAGSKIAKTSYAAYVQAWRSVQKLGFGTVTGVRGTRVAGRPATTMTVTFTRSLAGLARCAAANSPLSDCWSTNAGRTMRLAIVDKGSGKPPLLLYESWNSNNPNAQALATEFDAWVATVRFQ